jgi:hypothetical protein
MGNIAHLSSGILMDSKSNAINAQVCWKVTLIIITAVGIDVGLESCNHIGVFRLQDVAQKNVGLRTRTEEHVMF